MKGFLPVAESFGFTSLLRQNTCGKAFLNMVFDHYDVIEGDVFDSKSRLHREVTSIRMRKGLKIEIPQSSS